MKTTISFHITFCSTRTFIRKGKSNVNYQKVPIPVDYNRE